MVGDFLRRRKSDASGGNASEGAAFLPDGVSPSDDDSKVVPPWAEPLLCGSKLASRPCLGGECELLHANAEYLARRCRPPRGGLGKVVVCAGPERSGSTWLFNAVRLMLQVRNRKRVQCTPENLEIYVAAAAMAGTQRIQGTYATAVKGQRGRATSVFQKCDATDTSSFQVCTLSDHVLMTSTALLRTVWMLGYAGGRQLYGSLRREASAGFVNCQLSAVSCH